MASANYPDWVMKYKSKGVYVNKVGNTYYLYRAHCVYDKTTKKNKRVSDGYIGRVTEEDGFIPVKDKVQGDIYVYEYGLYFFLSALLKDVYKSLKANKKKDTVMALAIMKYLDYFEYFTTGLFNIYKNVNIELFNDKDVNKEAERISNMLSHFISTRVKDNDWQYLLNALPSIHLVQVNEKYYISSYSNELKQALNKYNMEMK